MLAVGQPPKVVTIGHFVTLGHLAIFLLWSTRQIKCDDTIVETEKGKVSGFSETVNGKQVDVFYGIPYAAPPVKELRYRPPIQNEPWTGVRDATQLPDSCYQGYDHHFGNFSGSNVWNPNTPVSEDCLYLNVWTPRTNPPFEGKAVMVWIYGGGFFSGTSTLDIYSASYLAAENDVVVVSMQYRVGSLGFLALNSSEAPGNAGIWDQKMALEWVVKNIQNFGGNPNSITLMGESAGAISAGIFLFCENCSHLFQRVILQSGAPQAAIFLPHKEDIVERSEKFAKLVDCDIQGDHNETVNCLRGIEYTTQILELEKKVIDAAMQLKFTPIVDNYLIPDELSKLINAGRFRKVPILLGANENEGSTFLAYLLKDYNAKGGPSVSYEKFTFYMKNIFFRYFPHHPHVLSDIGKEAILTHYRDWVHENSTASLIESMQRAMGDSRFVCPVNELARAYSKHGVPVYYYWFSQRWSASPWPEWMGVQHGNEIWFTFGHPLNQSYSFTEGERDLSRKIMAYWTNFAKTGDPNNNSGDLLLPEWPQFKHNEQKFLNLSVASLASNHPWGQGPRAQHCTFWDEYLPKLLARISVIKETEQKLEKQVREWKQQFIVDWKTQFDEFLVSYQRKQMSTC